MKRLTKKIIRIAFIMFIVILLIGLPFVFVEGSGVLSGSFTYVGLVILSCVFSEIHSEK